MDKFVIVGGVPRSGTNLARRIIGSHSEIAIPPSESKFLEGYVQGKSVAAILTREKMKSWNIDFCDLYSREHGDVFIAALVRYAESLGKVIPGEKTPFNEFYYDIVREWLNDFELKFVHILRNPFDATASYKHFGQATFRRGKSNGGTSDISAYCRNWVRSVYIGLAKARYDSERYYLLKYEDLAADPINTTRDLCEFLGVDFEEERMLSLSDFSGHRDNTSFSQDRGRKHAEYSVIRKPKSRKNYLTDSELRVVSAICGELAKALGYVDDDFRSSPPERTGGGIKEKLRRVAGGSILSRWNFRRARAYR